MLPIAYAARVLLSALMLISGLGFILALWFAPAQLLALLVQVWGEVAQKDWTHFTLVVPAAGCVMGWFALAGGLAQLPKKAEAKLRRATSEASIFRPIVLAASALHTINGTIFLTLVVTIMSWGWSFTVGPKQDQHFEFHRLALDLSGDGLRTWLPTTVIMGVFLVLLAMDYARTALKPNT